MTLPLHRAVLLQGLAQYNDGKIPSIILEALNRKHPETANRTVEIDGVVVISDDD